MAISSSPLSQIGATSNLGADTRSLEALRSSAARDPKAVIKEAAKQFEALFMQQLMKSMRQATMSSGMLDNSGTELGTEMLDTQFATKMTGLPGGLSDAIVRQLERQMTGTLPPVAPSAAAGAAGSIGATGSADLPVSQRQADFLRSHHAAARQAEAQSGIPAAFMVAQAAHESGWGRHEIRNADGSSSHNLFGIKAGPGWTGPVAEITTTEYVGGEAQKVTAKFRAYASYDESFRDYARLMKESPRYAGVVAQVAQVSPSVASARDFAQGLQRAGYATDPAYADKLSRVINTTLRMQRVVT
jgi:flagellar protein FlgJ